MEARAVIDLVAKMREAQRAYFRTRSPADLERSKSLEKRVDIALRDYLSGPSLFETEPEEDRP